MTNFEKYCSTPEKLLKLLSENAEGIFGVRICNLCANQRECDDNCLSGIRDWLNAPCEDVGGKQAKDIAKFPPELQIRQVPWK